MPCSFSENSENDARTRARIRVLAGALEARHLIIVGEPELRPEEKDYIMDLRKRCGLPVTYTQFDMTKKALV